MIPQSTLAEVEVRPQEYVAYVDGTYYPKQLANSWWDASVRVKSDNLCSDPELCGSLICPIKRGEMMSRLLCLEPAVVDYHFFDNHLASGRYYNCRIRPILPEHFDGLCRGATSSGHVVHQQNSLSMQRSLYSQRVVVQGFELGYCASLRCHASLRNPPRESQTVTHRHSQQLGEFSCQRTRSMFLTSFGLVRRERNWHHAVKIEEAMPLELLEH